MDTSQTRKLANANEVPAGDMKRVKTEDQEILLVNPGTGIFALNNKCIHGGCSLLNGKLDGDLLTCPCHSSVFNVRTGAVVNGPATKPQPMYAVIVRNGEITLAP